MMPRAGGTTGPDRIALAAAIGAAINTGVFYSWSTMVMPAIGQLPPSEGIAAMHELNGAAPAPFSVVALGTAARCAAAVVSAFRQRGTTRGRGMLCVGGSLFFVAAIVVTFAINVPLSYSIDQLTAASASREEWTELRNRWAWANHLRTFGCAVSTAVLGWAARRP